MMGNKDHVSVLLLRQVLQGLVDLFCLFNITDIQRKHSPRPCAKQRMKGKQVHSHWLLAAGWPSARDRQFVFQVFFFFQLFPTHKQQQAQLIALILKTRKTQEKETFDLHNRKRAGLLLFKPSVANYVCCCPPRTNSCSSGWKFTRICSGEVGFYSFDSLISLSLYTHARTHKLCLIAERE